MGKINDVIVERIANIAETLKEQTQFDPQQEIITEIDIEVNYFQNSEGAVSPVVKAKLKKERVLA